MRPFSRKLARLRLLNDSSKLCFGAAVGFGLVGSTAVLVAYFSSREPRLRELLWIGLFYVVLGALEHFNVTRLKKHTSTVGTSGRGSRREAIERRSTSKAA